MTIQLTAKRGNCAACGYYGWLTAEGGLIPHEVRRVRLGLNGEAERYASMAVGDDTCEGAGVAPMPLPDPRPKYMVGS
jgi:hypothetical protein